MCIYFQNSLVRSLTLKTINWERIICATEFHQYMVTVYFLMSVSFNKSLHKYGKREEITPTGSVKTNLGQRLNDGIISDRL